MFESAIADAGLLAVGLIFFAFWMLVVMVSCRTEMLDPISFLLLLAAVVLIARSETEWSAKAALNVDHKRIAQRAS